MGTSSSAIDSGRTPAFSTARSAICNRTETSCMETSLWPVSQSETAKLHSVVPHPRHLHQLTVDSRILVPTRRLLCLRLQSGSNRNRSLRDSWDRLIESPRKWAPLLRAAVTRKRVWQRSVRGSTRASYLSNCARLTPAAGTTYLSGTSGVHGCCRMGNPPKRRDMSRRKAPNHDPALCNCSAFTSAICRLSPAPQRPCAIRWTSGTPDALTGSSH